jgi:hypothetical protein
MAATGSSRAAIAAGTIPATNPIIEETPRPKTIFLNLNAPRNSGYNMDDKYVRDYNSSMEATFSPLKVHVKSDF